MAQSNFDRMMALNGASPSKTDTTLSPTSVLNKQASVEEMSKMKQVLLGNEQTQRAIVTADQQGNDLAQDEQVQDALYMDPFEFAVKYGVAAYNRS